MRRVTPSPQRNWAAMVLVVLVAASVRAVSAQGELPLNSCSSILETTVYKAFYLNNTVAQYQPFRSAVCSLESAGAAGSPAAIQLQLPLVSPQQRRYFTLAAHVLVKEAWSEDAMDSPSFSTSKAYLVVRDFHVAVCKGLPVSVCFQVSGSGSF